MSADLEFHYKKALKRQKFTEADVDELREKVKKFESVPKSVGSKKVWKKEEKKNVSLEMFSMTKCFLCFSSCVFWTLATELMMLQMWYQPITKSVRHVRQYFLIVIHIHQRFSNAWQINIIFTYQTPQTVILLSIIAYQTQMLQIIFSAKLAKLSSWR